MPEYHYQALGGDGKPFTGVIVASTDQQARANLEQASVFVIKIKPTRKVTLRRNRVTEADLKDLAEELIALLRAGIQLMPALAILCEEEQGKELNRHLREVAANVEKGSSLYEACGRYPEIFSSDFVRAVKSGERQSNLVDALDAYRELVAKRLQVRRSIGQALAYPIFLLSTVAVAILVLFVFVVPKFEQMLAGFNSELPGLTRAVIAISESLPLFIAALVAGFVASAVALKKLDNSGRVKNALAKLSLAIPVYGGIRRYSTLISFYGMLESSIRSGMPVAVALREVAGSFQGGHIGPSLQTICNEVNNGAGLGEAMATTGFFVGRDLKLVEIGERSGNLAGVFEGLSIRYKEKLDNIIAQFASLIEPMIMLVIGLLVGTVVIAMYMPVFMMAEVI
ncbi:type II secretion system F family protein [Microbulbifer sp. CNSA002]|uniref:type II secretion system F family protein n=1 Tax=unclassified Microbulbifer TaxID=2619833 RepID=UPI0039B69509